MIERQIVIGLITSSDYLQQIKGIWNIQLLESPTAKRLAGWCWEYFGKYNKAPGKDIEGIYYSKLKGNKFPKEVAEEIEQDILPGLSSEYEKGEFNLEYLLQETRKYFQERHLSLFSDSIQALIAVDDLTEADKIASEYKPLSSGVRDDLDLGDPLVLDRVDKAFTEANNSLFKYPRQLGEFWNPQLVRGGFIALMASEKRGKTFWLLDMAIRACINKCNVAFFQAGDMTESQQLKRICVYLAKKSDQSRYCGPISEPVRDCVFNQLNECEKKERLCSFGVFEGRTVDKLRSEITLDDLIKAYDENKDYVPCANCVEYDNKRWGAVWIKKVDVGKPLTVEEAKEAMSEFFLKNSRHFKLSSHANDTLSVKEIRAILSIWEKQDQFIPDVIVIDYADLLASDEKEERAKQNKVWKELRRLSQEKGQPLVITATQADANSYEKNRLALNNFSEDKRKYAHVTAMWGLNQDPKGREKKIGIMRINEIVIREGEFANINEVTVLQNLKRGRPFLTSYW